MKHINELGDNKSETKLKKSMSGSESAATVSSTGQDPPWLSMTAEDSTLKFFTCNL